MRILIVGAGIAGLTLAALLKQRGIEATLIERAPNFEHAGYMLSLYPIGNRILHGLGLHEQFIQHSQAFTDYHLYNGEGKLINEYPFQKIIAEYGPIQTIMRGDLLKLLQQCIEPNKLHMNTSIKSLKEVDNEVQVEFSDGTHHSFDLVVGADGIHSQVRDIIFADHGVQHSDTRWGGWLWFADGEQYPRQQVREYWGTGFMLGIYPTQDKLGIIAAVPNKKACLEGSHHGRKALLTRICQQQDLSLPTSVIDSIPEDTAELFYWKLKDVRCKDWAKGRIVLLGDAATAFLPTAGVGATMAMESAAVLNEELARTNTRYVGNAIDLYIKRRKPRVEKAQTASRMIGKQMFLTSNLMANARNYMMKYYSLDSLSKNLTKLFDEPI